MSQDVQTAENEERQTPLFYFCCSKAGFIAMHEHDTRKFISILMESPFYMTLSLKERKSLLERLAESYPSFEDETDEQDDHG